MAELAKEILQVNLEDEMRQSYLDYAMSVIVGRALPDVRDGLKPVHRRVLYAMSELGNDWNKPYKKSARVVGDVIGKYHPHGDSAVYDTIVRMAQPFAMRYMLVDGQGNFGSVDGDAPAAMRYTEVRMARLAHEILADIDRQTVDFGPNYDETEHEPLVMPTRVPNLLVNGSAGIAVGMATNIPPHSLDEVVAATIALIEDPDLDIDGIMEHLPGPDFPTAGLINGAKGILDAYHTGRGRIYLRARTHVEEDEARGKSSIICTELPYQVNKARLLEKIAELVKEKKIEGITELRDESDKDGMRVVIELRRGEVPEVVLNNLFKQTAMQNVFGINMVALVNGQPRLLNIKEVLEAFIRLIAAAIDAKSPYTGGHCQRVPELTAMLARAACDSDRGPFRDFSLDSEEWEALRIAAWLHDCGKVTTPEYVVDKSTKLETIYDRIHEIRMRFEVLKREAEIACWKSVSMGGDRDSCLQTLSRQLAELDEEFGFIARCNEGGEFMSDEDIERVGEIARRTWRRTLDDRLGVSWEEGQRKSRQAPQALPVEEPLLADKAEHLVERGEADRMPADNPWGFRLDVPEHKYTRGEIYNCLLYTSDAADERG